jgi:hypothetical protein
LSSATTAEDEPRRAIRGQVAHARFGAKDRGEYRKAAGTIAEAENQYG